MHRKTTTRTFRQMTVTDIARKMAGEHGLKVGKLAALPGGPAEERHQVGETDWEYLSGSCAPPAASSTSPRARCTSSTRRRPQAAAAELVYGQNLQRFRPRVSSVGQVAEVNVRGWDVKSKQAIAKTAARPRRRRPSQNAQGRQASSAAARCCSPTAHVSTDAEAEAARQAAALRARPRARPGRTRRRRRPAPARRRLRRHRGRRHALRRHAQDRLGRPHLRQRGLRHAADAGRRRPAARRRPSAARRAHQLRRPPRRSASSPTTSTPTSSGRVKVKYPLLNDEVESGWARIALGRGRRRARHGGAAARQRRGRDRLRARRRAPAVRPRRALQRRRQAGRRPRQGRQLGRGALPARPRRRDAEEGRCSTAART